MSTDKFCFNFVGFNNAGIHYKVERVVSKTSHIYTLELLLIIVNSSLSSQTNKT